ncbi:MAG TPA: hypothetical protein VKA41_13215 [Solirubrobacterales bacterium]|nr:hypothetical protein [Solirubrobacterales bacterium]
MANLLRYLDLALLAVALPVFLAADLPMAGYIVIALVWIAQHGIELWADRSAARAMERGDRRAAMGWVGATTLARVWIIALAVLLVGLIDSKDAGLAAAVLAAILFTVHFGARLLIRLIEPEESRS